MLSPSVRDYRRSCSLSTQRRHGRASDPFLIAIVVWEDPASRRPPIHIPTTFRYIFVRNRLSSTSPSRYVAACASFSTSQPLLIGWSNDTYFSSSIVRGKATSWSRILYSLRPKILVIEMDVSRCILVLDTSILMTSNSGWREYLVQTRNKVGVGEFSMYIRLGTNRKERG